MVASAVLLLFLQLSAMEDCIDIGDGAAALGTLTCTLPAGSTFVQPWNTAWYRVGAVLSFSLTFVPLVAWCLLRIDRKA